MPVTVRPCDHKPREVRDKNYVTDVKTLTARTDTYACYLGEYGDDKTGLVDEPWVTSSNGFLDAIRIAYSNHHHLIIRPEDIWVQVLTQFACYVQRNAEALRSQFVEHAGQKKLQVQYTTSQDTRYTFDYTRFTRDIADMIDNDVKDPTLRDWIVPDFSTTTEHDRDVARVLLMATLQRYYEYEIVMGCGIPSITLLGEQGDYEMLFSKLDKLDEYGVEPARFAKLLRPVIRYFVATFDNPHSEDVIKFWRQIGGFGGASGMTAWTGWISAFCFWNEEGRCSSWYTDADDKAGGVGIECDGDDDGRFDLGERNKLYIEGVRYNPVHHMPLGIATVPVTIIDMPDLKPVQAQMTVGSVGIAYTSSGDELDANQVLHGYSRPATRTDFQSGLDTLQPITGWWIHGVPRPYSDQDWKYDF